MLELCYYIKIRTMLLTNNLAAVSLINKLTQLFVLGESNAMIHIYVYIHSNMEPFVTDIVEQVIVVPANIYPPSKQATIIVPMSQRAMIIIT